MSKGVNSDKNYIYVGEITRINNDVKKEIVNKFLDVINKYNKSDYIGDCCWTDGGFYLSNIKNLQI